MAGFNIKKSIKFQILIPTYNRCNDLRKNLEHLGNQLNKYNLQDEFGIFVSDNASNDDTLEMLQAIAIDWKGKIELKVISNETNVGLEQNVVSLLENAISEYVIWLGDDDILAEGYLSFIHEQFCNKELGWMIPGLLAYDELGNKVSERPIDYFFEEKSSGYETIYQLSHLAHSMSGLVVKRKGLLEKYLIKSEWRNVYLFIFFVAYCQLHYPGIHAPGYQTIINISNSKDWGYNRIGLLDEVFKSYYYLKSEIGNKRLNKLLIRFVVMHSYRLNFEKGVIGVLGQGNEILKMSNRPPGLKMPLYIFLIKELMARKIKSFKQRFN